jgi:hypothetical protein
MKRQPPSIEFINLEADLFLWLITTYVQRFDARQKILGLQYMEAETHDLAKGLAAFIRRRYGQL